MKITAGTIARTIVLALALVNQILAACGINIIPIDDETINTLVATAFTVVTAVIAWWKNNSFTKKALAADMYMRNEDDEVDVAVPIEDVYASAETDDTDTPEDNTLGEP